MIISAIRTLILYIFIIVAVRIMGKRQISELQTSEFVVTLLVSNIASLPMQDTDQSMLSGMVPILILIVCEVFLSALMLKRAKFRRLICGKPIVVINDGKVDQKKMRMMRMSTEDLYEQLRQQDVFRIEDVAYAVVETNGRLSVLKKPQYEPVTAQQMGIKTTDKGIQTVVVSDGEISDSSLNLCGLDRIWLMNILENERTMLKDIFIMTADKRRQYQIIRKENLK
ncbi:MAG: DUF421 domain-containing protein [Acutalibacteraceae bacterium]